MNKKIYSVITGAGNYIPTKQIKNEDFLSNEFYESNGEKITKTSKEITEKFHEITTIAERRYISDDLKTSSIIPGIKLFPDEVFNATETCVPLYHSSIYSPSDLFARMHKLHFDSLLSINASYTMNPSWSVWAINMILLLSLGKPFHDTSN